MAQAYWINKANGKYYLHFKITQPAGSQVTWTVTKDSNFQPELPANFWDFWEDFDGDTLDTNTWDASNYDADYSVSDSNLNTWNNSGGCCNGSCYYTAIYTKQSFNLPIRVILAANQDPYQSATNCGKTGAFVIYKDSIEVITSTDTDSDSCAWRIGNSYGTITNSTAMPDLAPEYYMLSVNMGTDRIEVDHNWWGEKFVKTGSPTYTSNQPIGIGGDTDASNVVDHIGYIAIANSHNEMPTVSIIEQTDEYIKVQVDDSGTNNSLDFDNFIITVELPDGWIADVLQGLKIENKTVYMLVENPDDSKVYTWDTNNSSWVNLNKAKNELTSDDFINNGIIAPLYVSKSDLSNLTQTPNFLYYCQEGLASADCVVRFLPYSRLVTQKTAFNLKDFTQLNKFFHTWQVSSWCNGVQYGFATVVSRDNRNWYKWDPDNSQWVSLGERELDYLNQDDIDWVNNNGVGLGNYSQLTETEWYEFFGNGYPDYLYVAIVFNIGCIDDDLKLDALYGRVNTKMFWEDVSDQHEIRFTENNISIKFNSGGTYKVNYLD